MSEGRPPPEPREPWESRGLPDAERVWRHIDRMWGDLKLDSAERAKRAEEASAKFEAVVWKAIEKLDQTKSDKWVQTAMAGAITAVVMAVLMAVLALVVVGKPGKSQSDHSSTMGEP